MNSWHRYGVVLWQGLLALRARTVLVGTVLVSTLLASSMLMGPMRLEAEEPVWLPPLPAETRFSESIASPEVFAGSPFGSRLWQHHQVLAYCRYLDEVSDRVVWTRYATSHGGRELGYLTIASASNWAKLDAIREAHRNLADPDRSSQVEIASLPLVMHMGYGVHGDEPSATHAALVMAYLLAAGEGPEIDRWLEHLVIRIDPCLNPDGFEWFSSWSGQLLGARAVSEPWHREHRQAWPGGRVNHYWFDLNRDWLPAVHPESQGRLSEYRQWRPVVVLDFHEMGTDSTYFFQPGEPRRNHPRAPVGTRELTRQLAEKHAAALDRLGVRYFTEERFDDFYPGKGSTYPDLHGGVGILFEQSSARGIVQTGNRGLRTLVGTIRNQTATSISSLVGTLELREALLENVRRSYLEARDEAQREPFRGYVVRGGGDPVRLERFIKLLEQHEIRGAMLKESCRLAAMDGSEVALEAGDWFIPLSQPEYRLLRAMFDTPTDFEENAFYDVSAWAIPLAFDLDVVQVAALPEERLLGAWERPVLVRDKQLDSAAIAYVASGQSDASPAAVATLISRGYQVHVASEPLVVESSGVSTRLEAGALLVFVQDEAHRVVAGGEQLPEALHATGLNWIPLSTGLTAEGIDLGSGGWYPIPRPRVALVIGEGVDRYAAGAIWHHLDRELGIDVTLLDGSDLPLASREAWTAMILAGGMPAEGPATKAAIEGWMERGGTLIVTGDATRWAIANQWIQGASPAPQEVRGRRPYAEAGDDRALERIAGAIVNVEIDLTHPVGWGLRDARVPMFRDHTTWLAPSADPYATPGIYGQNPVAAGYVSERNRVSLATSASLVVGARGRGRVIAFAEMPVYRGFFHGSTRLLDNAVLYGPLIESR